MSTSSVEQQQFDGANFVPTKLWFNNTNTNYRVWREHIICLIESQGLLGFIDGTKAPPPETVDGTDTAEENVKNQDYDTWRRSDLLLKGWILSSLNEDVVYTVYALKTSKDIWSELSSRYLRLFNLDPPTDGGTVPVPKGVTRQNSREKDLREYLPLHRAAVQGNWEEAKQIFKDDPASMTAHITLVKSTALHTAIGTGKANHFVEQLVAAMPFDLIAHMDGDGGTALTTAAIVGNIA